LRAFVGSNADYYLRVWAPALTGESGDRGFNWAAAILSATWLLYRRMYGRALIVYAVLAAAAFIDVRSPADASGRRPPVVEVLAGGGVVLVCGLWGNSWYLSRAHRAVRQTPGGGTDEATRQAALRRAGGTNLVGAFTGALLFGVGLRLLFVLLGPGASDLP
jgi:hypothetical protein